MDEPTPSQATLPATATPAGPSGLAPDVQEFLKALGSPTRQRIMMLFAQGAELSVGHVAERVGISQATASQQLNLLRRGRVVTSRRDGKTVYYRADRDGARAALAELQSYLNTCC
ncbi:metalloregulator ArsR/SmtB family transcription factor [Micromonospora sp. WMMD964]|uniref:ArsR/SmtB family transcription factor n=1 Tax=Micromonospora sp. WMMD964 TaxID=3016091 RepID=UPI00249AEAA5|nr:metalloregulator ArsR/SmtB family transcription factor [Micromonospora sp. WMMD964]WFF03734.1 metalloregulator ArsR/SmtB family transcription factor [Micromonospora sp. WMMD964]